MQINQALLLCAGLGTRMGNIGKHIPKPLWPIFEKNLLELQIDLVNSWGVKNIFINIHHQAEKFNAYQNQVNILFESNLLGSGGAVYNLKRNIDFTNNNILLLHNTDQFTLYPKSLIEKGLAMLRDYPIVLFGIEVDATLGHNPIIVENGFLKEIGSSKQVTSNIILTYSGTALIDLNQIGNKEEFQNFFDDLVDYKKQKIPVLFEKNIECWDFGTLTRYKNSLFDLLLSDKSFLYRFLKDHKAIDPSHFENNKYYFGSGLIDLNKNIISYNSSIIDIKNNSIYIDEWSDTLC